MSQPTPDQVKALIIIGLFKGQMPERTPGAFVRMNVSEEMVVRLGDLSDIEFEFDWDPMRCCFHLTMHRSKSANDMLREAIKRKMIREAYAPDDDEGPFG